MKRGILIAVCLAAAVGVVQGQRDSGPASSDAPPRFINVAPADGLDFRHVNGGTAERHLLEIMGSGGLFFDYDEDGWVDIFLVDGGSLVDRKVDATARDRLYRNRGDGTFQDVSTSSGIVRPSFRSKYHNRSAGIDGAVEASARDLAISSRFLRARSASAR